MSTIDTALSGLAAASTRVQVLADNIANSNDTAPLPPTDKPQSYSGFVPQSVVQVPLAGGGTQASAVAVSPAYLAAAATPGDAQANAQGLIAVPNVDLGIQIAGLQQTQLTYAVNAKVLSTADKLLGTLLDVLK